MSLPVDFPEAGTKFLHTRAQLSYLARLSTSSADDDLDDESRVTSNLVTKVVSLLVDEREDELKELLLATLNLDPSLVDQAILDLMHKHRDDAAGVPFLFLTPSKRPISRPSSRASNPSSRLNPNRPDPPNSAPSSPLVQLFKRPHTPATSPLAHNGSQSSTYGPVRANSDYGVSPNVSPVLANAQAAAAPSYAQYTSSLPASPLSSPRLLNAKASEFRPVIQRPLSATGALPTSLRAESPDMWSHNVTSSFRATSNLAIAAPLIPERPRSQSPSLLARSAPTQNVGRSNLHSEFYIDDEIGVLDGSSSLSDAYPFPNVVDQFASEDWNIWNYPSLPMSDTAQLGDPSAYNSMDLSAGDDAFSDPGASLLTDGMTPFDVLSSVFGSTLPPSELEEALALNGYDFEKASAWLVERALPPTVYQGTPSRQQSAPTTSGSRTATVVPREGFKGRGSAGFGIYNQSSQRVPPRYVNGRPVTGGNRVCRYFVAGECLRADCRFSHDLERALCRFWLRGTCAKNDQCEFLHHLPKDTDLQNLQIAMARAGVAPGTGPLADFYPPMQERHDTHEDFPVLGAAAKYDDQGLNGKAAAFDPSRTRFAAAVKKAPVANIRDQAFAVKDPMLVTSAGSENGSQGAGLGAGSGSPSLAVIAPRPSPRLPLRPATLIPSIPTGNAVNKLYMSYRERGLQLGAARNACLSRAADAWRRGDGAAAKRFSRDANSLNVKMRAEMREAAEGLVRVRGQIVREAVSTSRMIEDMNGRDGGRKERGKECGAGLGVLLGISSAQDNKKGTMLSPEERMEAMIDLHGLHSNEATEVLEQFLLALEQEHFYGLAYAVVGEEKHTGTQDPARGTSRARLAAGVKEWLHRWGYPWMERDGILCIDALTHGEE